MSKHMQREIDKLKSKILSVGARVETAIAKAITALKADDADLARSVIEEDGRIDELEVDVEEECLKILALYQPVATDLRFVIAVLKINNDLERMGDLATHIAKRATFLAANGKPSVRIDFSEMAAKAQSMVKRCLDALVNSDVELAKQICIDDEDLNAFRTNVKKTIFDEIAKHPRDAGALMELFAVGRHLERLGDMATNVAEDVIYMVDGAIIRHRISEILH